MTSFGRSTMCRGIPTPTRKCAISSLKLLQFHRSRLYVCAVNRGESSIKNVSNKSSGMCVSPRSIVRSGRPKCVPPGAPHWMPPPK
eukprot:31342-Pelagococcus_subviridis.AAC.11